MDNLAWLASYPKSGNTFVRLLFSAYMTGRCDINAVFCSVSDTYVYPYQTVAPKPLSEMENWEWAACAAAAALHVPKAIRERPLLIKTHHAALRPFGYTVIPPFLCKKAIYLIRDPRDIAVSYAKHLGKDVNHAIDMMGDDMAVLTQDDVPPQFVCSWANHVASWLNQGDIEVMGVKYEDLVDSTEETFAAIIRFLGDQPHAKRLKEAVSLTELPKLRKQEKEKGFSEASKHSRFFGAGGSAGRIILTDAQYRRLEKEHGDAMRMLGYLESKAA